MRFAREPAGRFAREAGWLAALLVGSLGIKAVALNRPEPGDDTAAYLARAARALDAAGFATRLYRGNSVLATRGGCTLRVRDFPPYGFSRADVESKNAATGPTRYAYRGRWLADPPKLVPLGAFYLQRELARVGIAVPRQGIMAVALAPSCPPLAPGWTALSMHLH